MSDCPPVGADEDEDFEPTDEQVALTMMTCPYYHGIGTCRNGCYSEPSCITDGPFTAPPGYSLEQLKTMAAKRLATEREPA